MNYRDYLKRGLACMDQRLDETAVANLCLYCAELIRWNSRINLVARASAEEIVERHFLDSLTLLPVLRTFPQPVRLMDVGAGAGFPGLALKAACPDLAVTLVEPRQKRVSFLRHIVRTLHLTGTAIIAGRLEKRSIPDGLESEFSVVTGRAFTRMADFLDLVAPCSPPGGRAICMKGPRAEEEIAAWRHEQANSPYRLERMARLNLPFSGATRVLVIFRKS